MDLNPFQYSSQKNNCRDISGRSNQRHGGQRAGRARADSAQAGKRIKTGVCDQSCVVPVERKKGGGLFEYIELMQLIQCINSMY
jgi:hypothetical protein